MKGINFFEGLLCVSWMCVLAAYVRVVSHSKRINATCTQSLRDAAFQSCVKAVGFVKLLLFNRTLSEFLSMLAEPFSP